MREILLGVLSILMICSCTGREPNDLEYQLVERIRQANNERDYDVIKPFIASEFHFEGSDQNTSFTLLYSYLNYHLSAEISSIKIKHVKEVSDSVSLIQGTYNFENYGREKIVLKYKLTADGAKILSLNSLKPHKFRLVTRATYRNDEIFGDNPVENIKNLSVLDYSTAETIGENGYTVYYDNELQGEGAEALQLLQQLDRLLINRFEIDDIEKENLYLTKVNTNNTITVGMDSKIPWVLALYESDSINKQTLFQKMGNTFSHEIVEGTLVKKYKLKGYPFRWFRDGLAEYIAYQYCKMIAPQEAESYFIGSRLSSASTFAKDGNLLDWRGNGPIDKVDQGKLYGDRFIHFNEVGQYGRAFKFFKDLFEQDETKLLQLLQTLKREEDITVEKVLDIMSDTLKMDIRELISEY